MECNDCNFTDCYNITSSGKIKALLQKNFLRMWRNVGYVLLAARLFAEYQVFLFFDLGFLFLIFYSDIFIKKIEYIYVHYSNIDIYINKLVGFHKRMINSQLSKYYVK